MEPPGLIGKHNQILGRNHVFEAPTDRNHLHMAALEGSRKVAMWCLRFKVILRCILGFGTDSLGIFHSEFALLTMRY